jgi:hypothetical protein
MFVGHGPGSDTAERVNAVYPHPHCVEAQPTVAHATIDRLPGAESGTWTDTIQIGAKNSPPGASFECLVLLTGKQASALLSEQIRDWCKPDPWPGIANLPEDSVVEDTVAIFR